jgi:hypothetical protein
VAQLFPWPEDGWVELTEDSFRALARSSPWRWTTLHFAHRAGFGEVEAWVKRPGRLLARQVGRPDTYESGLPYTTGSLTVSTHPELDPPEPERHVPQDVRPKLRPDGLVAERPGWGVDYDDPMYWNYSWVAMLDPVELSHHVAVSDLRVADGADRPAWRATLMALPGYDPRCGGNCCELLYSEAGLRADFPEPEEVPEEWGGRTYPEAYDVALDVQTGVVVRCLPLGGAEDAPWLENDILEVDADLDQVFAPYD